MPDSYAFAPAYDEARRLRMKWKLDGVSVVEDVEGTDDEVVPASPPVELFDPGEHTIDEVKSYVHENPDDVQRVYDVESVGKARKSLLAWLTGE